MGLMTPLSLTELFADHVAERQAKLEAALEATGFDALIVSSGEPHIYFADDQAAPFHTVAHFRHWCPMDGPHHVLRLEAGKKPFLIRYAPEDYWYEPASVDEPFWLAQFDVVEAGTVDAVWEALDRLPKAAYVGNETARAEGSELTVNPENLIARLDWDRAYKTGYEIQCLDEASALGAKGHVAALAAFAAGGSELDIHYAFVQAMGVCEAELPYPSIVAMNEKAAFLHYETKRSLREGKVLLIDAAAAVRGYASDITRTHVAEGCDPRFTELRDGMERLQQQLCRDVKPGLPFGELHQEAHEKIAELLVASGVLRASCEEAVSEGYTRPFFPHGLGHHLGLQVHDVGGHLAGPDGRIEPPPDAYPYLRNTRTIDPDQVFTIEPGIYFIEMLLRPFREGEASGRFDWDLVDQLMPCGGIRIEDNLVVTEDGHRNLTRAYLAS